MMPIREKVDEGKKRIGHAQVTDQTQQPDQHPQKVDRKVLALGTRRVDRREKLR
jgi:hypothetical protein